MDQATEQALVQTAAQMSNNAGSFVNQVATNANNSEKIGKTVDILNHGLEKAGQMVGQGIDFASEQVPDILHQFLMWELTRSIAVVILCIIGLVISWKILKSLAEAGRKAKIEEDAKLLELFDKEPETVNKKISLIQGFMHWDIGGIIGLALLLIVDFNVMQAGLDNGERALKIAIAPKVFIIEKGVEVYRDYKGIPKPSK